jgi:hypothetical protein
MPGMFSENVLDDDLSISVPFLKFGRKLIINGKLVVLWKGLSDFELSPE